MIIIITVFIFGLLVFVHELGHFLAAKRVGIRVEEFSLGFGPKLIAYPKGETEYAIRLFPLGGYVRMAGDSPESKDDPRGFARKSVGKRMSVIFAGPLMNFLLAALLFSLLVFFSGIPTGVVSETSQIGEIVLGEPADRAGLLPGDRITAIDGEPVALWNELVAIISRNPGQELNLTVERDDRSLDISVVPQVREDENRGWIGITPTYEVRQPGLIEGLVTGIKQTVMVTGYIVAQIFRMLTRQAPADVTGPLGVAQIIGQAARLGLLYVLNIAAVINVNIGLFNLFPIPALDGSRLFFLFTEAVRGRPVDPEKENVFHLVGFALLMVLAVFVLYRDVVRIWF